MHSTRQAGDAEGLAASDDRTRLLSTTEERTLLRSLADCKQKLADALGRIQGAEPSAMSDVPQARAHYIAEFYAGDPLTEVRLGAIYRHYLDLRGQLALANMRLVAHVAKRFRERGVAYSDLLQEGFCGLLEAIDRFDLSHGTKLATYATWWIRQAMQRAVASGAYPVRLSPRHLRQLAQSQDDLEGLSHHRPELAPGERDIAPAENSSELIRRIHTATRPTVSLNASFDSGSSFSLLQTMSDPDGDDTDAVDRQEAVTRLMEALRPREQEVLALRFGLRGQSHLSLSQTGRVLNVSKERVRQIQDRALEKLRDAAERHRIGDLLETGA